MEMRAWAHIHVYLLGCFATDTNTDAGVTAIYMHAGEVRPIYATLDLDVIRYRK